MFLPKAKSLGLRVIFDGVWNHVGLGHWAFADVKKNGSASRYASWFDVRFDEDGQLIGWKSWDGQNGHLPVFKQIRGDLAPGPKAHIMAVTRRWMDPNNDGDPSDGIDGWRLDVANEMGRPFWKDWRLQVRTVNDEALIIGELWFDGEDYFDGTAFDGQMNYPIAFALSDWLSIGGDVVHDGRVLAARAKAVFHHGLNHDLVQLNLMTSHDTERLASMMINDFPRGYDQGAKRWGSEPKYDAGVADADARERGLMAYAALVAMPGSPMIYNGDGYAMPGADDPDNRAPIPWDSLSKEQISFQQSVRWILRLRSDPVIGEALRLGVADFSSDSSGRGLIVRRVLGARVVEISIGAEGPREEGKPFTVPPELASWLEIRVMQEP
ncbi:MAG: hypothetical protein JKY96_06135 [Phycisphaerales bacterium]|nr:hypothetical protein [Phycisphaerales bacterium]